MHHARHEPITPQQQSPTTPAHGTASWRFGHSPAGGASEPEPAPGVAGSLPRQGAREAGAATGGGSQPGRRRGKPVSARPSSVPRTASASATPSTRPSPPAPKRSA